MNRLKLNTCLGDSASPVADFLRFRNCKKGGEQPGVFTCTDVIYIEVMTAASERVRLPYALVKCD